MELEIKPLQNTDYDDILVGWWSDWGWEAPDREFLPDDGTGGFIVYDGSEPICAGFVYVTNSKAAWVDWIVSSKTYRKKPQRSEALILLIESLTNVCRSSGFKFIYALIKHKGLINTYEKLGYTRGDSYNSEMIKKL
jgi:hypothetical protein|tara:strand:+ start:398 stop:808 length:411 start_codon:yes stop_codon:yes gene_type:complete